MSVQRKLSLLTFVVVSFLAGILFTTAGANLFSHEDKIGTDSFARTLTVDDQDSPLKPVEQAPSVLEFENAFVSVADVINPVVVQIRSERVTTSNQNNLFRGNPFEGTPFENMFPDQDDNSSPREFRSQALGSGVIVRGDGYIITNNHVIDGADELEVKLYDGSFYDATVIGTDPQSDLAVIKIDDTNLPAIQYGDVSSVRVGQWVLAFGSPLSEDLGNTVTSGIVSAVGRTSSNLSRLNLFSAFIQTDAAINPGNSGGPLVNLHGQLIGINSAIYSRSGGSQGVGFAIPVDAVKLVVDQLIEQGVVHRGFLGVSFGPVSEALADAIDVPRGAAQVMGITEDSAADKAGIQEGDVIVSVDDIQLTDFNQLPTIIANHLPGDVVELNLVRDGKTRTERIKLGQRPETFAAAGDNPEEESNADNMSSLGLSLQSVTPSVLAELRVTEQIEGAIITNIDESSAAYREADLRVGDIIVEADGKKISTAKDFEEVYSAISSDNAFLVKVVRARQDVVNTFRTALKKK